MKSKCLVPFLGVLLLPTVACRPQDSRVNSNAHPQGATEKSEANQRPRATAPSATTTPGTDSTGRPADSSGGTTGAEARDRTSGAETGSNPPAEKSPGR